MRNYPACQMCKEAQQATLRWRNALQKQSRTSESSSLQKHLPRTGNRSRPRRAPNPSSSQCTVREQERRRSTVVRKRLHVLCTASCHQFCVTLRHASPSSLTTLVRPAAMTPALFRALLSFFCFRRPQPYPSCLSLPPTPRVAPSASRSCCTSSCMS